MKKFLHVVQTGSGVHPTSYQMDALSTGVKRLGREADQSPPANAEVKKLWVYTSTPPYALYIDMYPHNAHILTGI
jgi:hypothetical protein